MARVLSVHLEKSLGQPIVIENSRARSTVTGTAALTQAAPDGHTVGMLFDSLAINAAFGMSLPYNSGDRHHPDHRACARAAGLIVNSQHVPMKTLPEW